MRPDSSIFVRLFAYPGGWRIINGFEFRIGIDESVHRDEDIAWIKGRRGKTPHPP